MGELRRKIPQWQILSDDRSSPRDWERPDRAGGIVGSSYRVDCRIAAVVELK